MHGVGIPAWCVRWRGAVDGTMPGRQAARQNAVKFHAGVAPEDYGVLAPLLAQGLLAGRWHLKLRVERLGSCPVGRLLFAFHPLRLALPGNLQDYRNSGSFSAAHESRDRRADESPAAVGGRLGAARSCFSLPMPSAATGFSRGRKEWKTGDQVVTGAGSLRPHGHLQGRPPRRPQRHDERRHRGQARQPRADGDSRARAGIHRHDHRGSRSGGYRKRLGSSAEGD